MQNDEQKDVRNVKTKVRGRECNLCGSTTPPQSHQSGNITGRFLSTLGSQTGCWRAIRSSQHPPPGKANPVLGRSRWQHIPAFGSGKACFGVWISGLLVVA